MKYRCVVSDLDRTILRRDGISHRTKEVLENWQTATLFLFRQVEDLFIPFQNASGRFGVSGMRSHPMGQQSMIYQMIIQYII